MYDVSLHFYIFDVDLIEKMHLMDIPSILYLAVLFENI